VIITAPDSLVTPAILRKIENLSKMLSAFDGVRQVVNPTLLFKEALFHAGIPQAALDNEQQLAALFSNQTERFRDFVTKDGTKMRLSLLIGTLDAADLERLRHRIQDDFSKTFGTALSLTITGNYEILLSTQAGLLETLKSSLLLTTGLMTLLFLIFLGSVRLTLVALIPNLFPVTLNFIIMHYLNVPLDVGTSMTAAIALGIAVDDTLHFMLSWKKSDIRATARSTGRAIILSSVIIGAGFVSLVFSDFTPTRNFGILCSTAMASALTADLFILPPLLEWVAPAVKRKPESSCG
jgi:hypothetical protein